MPERLIRSLAYHNTGPQKGDKGLPTRNMWVVKVPGGGALAGQPLFHLAPLGDVREQILGIERATVKAVSLAKDGPVEALIWSAARWNREETYSLASNVEAFFNPYFHAEPARHNIFTPYHHWIGMTRDRVWRSGGGERDLDVLGTYVHLLERLGPRGQPLPREPQGEIPAEDEAALTGLGV